MKPMPPLQTTQTLLTARIARKVRTLNTAAKQLHISLSCPSAFLQKESSCRSALKLLPWATRLRGSTPINGTNRLTPAKTTASPKKTACHPWVQHSTAVTLNYAATMCPETAFLIT